MVFMFLLVSRDSFGSLLIKKAAICLLMAVTNRCLRDNNFVEFQAIIETGYPFLKLLIEVTAIITATSLIKNSFYFAKFIDSRY